MIRIRSKVSLLPYNTFHLDVASKYFVTIKKPEDIHELLQDPLWGTCPFFILGEGANLLLTKDYPGLMIKMNILGKEIINEGKDVVYLKVGAGENRDRFVRYCVKNNRGGVENLIRIPGAVGSAPVGNIGAYGCEAKDSIYQVIGIDLRTGKKKTLSNKQCNFVYRNSIFKQELKDKFIITHVVFRLEKVGKKYILNTNYADIQATIGEKKNISLAFLAKVISDIRGKKLPDPKKIGTAGSFFKNPVLSIKSYTLLLKKYPTLKSYPYGNGVKLAAGQLIELAGFKGKKVGHVGVHPQHALVLIHYGKGKGKDIVNLANTIQKKVYTMFGVHLEPEVIYV